MKTTTSGYFKAAKYEEHNVLEQDFFFFDGTDVDSVSKAYREACDCAFQFGGAESLSVWRAPKVTGPWSKLPSVGIARLSMCAPAFAN